MHTAQCTWLSKKRVHFHLNNLTRLQYIIIVICKKTENFTTAAGIEPAPYTVLLPTVLFGWFGIINHFHLEKTINETLFPLATPRKTYFTYKYSIFCYSCCTVIGFNRNLRFFDDSVNGIGWILVQPIRGVRLQAYEEGADRILAVVVVRGICDVSNIIDTKLVLFAS